MSLVDWVGALGVCASGGGAGEAGAAHAAEVARALRTQASLGARLAAALRADLAARRPYAAYLASCRAALAHTDRVLHASVSNCYFELKRRVLHYRPTKGVLCTPPYQITSISLVL